MSSSVLERLRLPDGVRDAFVGAVVLGSGLALGVIVALWLVASLVLGSIDVWRRIGDA